MAYLALKLSRPMERRPACGTGRARRFSEPARAPPRRRAARCRVRRGHCCHALATAAVPAYFGIAAVVPRSSRACHGRRATRRSTGPPMAPGITARSKASPSPAWHPRAARQANLIRTPSASTSRRSEDRQTENGTSPWCTDGSRPAFTPCEGQLSARACIRQPLTIAAVGREAPGRSFIERARRRSASH